MKKTILIVLIALFVMGCTASIIYINKSDGAEINKRFTTDVPTDSELNFAKNDSIQKSQKKDSILN